MPGATVVLTGSTRSTLSVRVVQALSWPARSRARVSIVYVPSPPRVTVSPLAPLWMLPPLIRYWIAAMPDSASVPESVN